MKGNSFRLGIKHTPEACEKMKEKRKGRTPSLGMRQTEDFKKKVSERFKGKPLSVEHREKISRGNTGKIRTAEHSLNFAISRAKISLTQCELIKGEYVPGLVTMRDIAARYGCSAQTICNVVNGKRMGL